MAKTTYKENSFKDPESEKPWLQRLSDLTMRDVRFQLVLGGFLLLVAFALLVAFTSYFFTGVDDQSIVEGGMRDDFQQNAQEVQNWLGLTGATLAHIFIFKWFGIAAFVLVPIIFILGWRLIFKTELFPLMEALKWGGVAIFWTTILLSVIFPTRSGIGFWGGGIGFMMSELLRALFGMGAVVIVLFAFAVFLYYFVQMPAEMPSREDMLKNFSNPLRNLASKIGEWKPTTKDTTATATVTPDKTTKTPLDKTIISPTAKTTPKEEEPEGITIEIDNSTPEDAFSKGIPRTDTKDKDKLTKTIPPKDKAFSRPNPKIELEIEAYQHEEDDKDLGKTRPPKGVQKKIDFEVEEGEEFEPEEEPIKFKPNIDSKFDPKTIIGKESFSDIPDLPRETIKPKSSPDDIEEMLEEIAEDEKENPKLVRKLEIAPVEEEKEEDVIKPTSIDESGLYDPTLDLSRYMKPIPELLNETVAGRRQVTNEELEANKDRIVETLSNYGIGISQIKATIGPTVTLYEIIPEAGVRISKIKNLEDDIALSLAALGIRIIAPIPGKGTIGIEVPNKKREMVTMRAILESDIFRNTEKVLPVILGKSITNEIVVADLAKMPHVLMAGATGQGKSVGLNVFLTSLIYKKHPAELKFVLIDPKKVELTLFNRIEKHFLAKLPGDDEAIITDTSKVVATLTSLCMEMDSRYSLLKDASCRNIQEYNTKFRHRRLNPKKGHKFLPYIVLVIDELADLMMVAGKEVEQPIARLAQLARAIGIHLIVATQRPSVNVITGIIKANFPARLSFKVTSKIDSRTILDAGGAEQLVGQGDFLFSMGSDIIRLQCPFIDTPEVERICDFIAEQQGYGHAYELPELPTDSEFSGSLDDDGDRDPLFEDAARIIVLHQQGSTSLLQRRLKLGYNRAGRLIDQLEKAGIVGAFEGSKAREVLIADEYALERLLTSMEK
ncbi:MAG: DNA translocase FtsK [Bacteroidetes bacterium]|nr:MAG: DNA translocase FtsK [Bacteroidota bacterium]